MNFKTLNIKRSYISYGENPQIKRTFVYRVKVRFLPYIDKNAKPEYNTARKSFDLMKPIGTRKQENI